MQEASRSHACRLPCASSQRAISAPAASNGPLCSTNASSYCAPGGDHAARTFAPARLYQRLHTSLGTPCDSVSLCARAGCRTRYPAHLTVMEDAPSVVVSLCRCAALLSYSGMMDGDFTVGLLDSVRRSPGHPSYDYACQEEQFSVIHADKHAWRSTLCVLCSYGSRARTGASIISRHSHLNACGFTLCSDAC